MNDTVNRDPLAGRLWRIIFWGGAALLLALPALAMQLTDEVNWGSEDFIFAGILFFAVGVALEFTVRKSRDWSYRAAMLGFIGGTFLTFWVNGAVGIIGNESLDINTTFNVMALAGVLAAFVVRAQAGKMMAIAGVQALVVLATGFAAEFTSQPDWGPVLVFAAGWLVVTLMFRAARQG